MSTTDRNDPHGLEDLPVLSPYQQWQQDEGVPIHHGTYVESLSTLEVGPWKRVGQQGALVTLAEQEKDDGQLIEIAPGIDLQRDVLACMGFAPIIREPLREMDGRLFRPEPVGLNCLPPRRARMIRRPFAPTQKG